MPLWLKKRSIMNKLVLLALPLILAGNAGAQTLAQQEATLQAEFRSNPHHVSLVKLAQVREAQGKWSQARATWEVFKSLGNKSYSKARWSGDYMTWDTLANWWIARLLRRQNGVKQADTAQKRAADTIYRKLKTNSYINARRADMDGDGLPEIAYTVRNRANVNEIYMFRVVGWRDGAYKELYQITGFQVPKTFYFSEGVWPALHIGQTDAKDRGLQYLLSNGEQVIKLDD